MPKWSMRAADDGDEDEEEGGGDEAFGAAFPFFPLSLLLPPPPPPCSSSSQRFLPCLRAAVTFFPTRAERKDSGEAPAKISGGGVMEERGRGLRLRHEVIATIVVAIDREPIRPKKKKLTLVLDSIDLDDRLADEMILGDLPGCLDFGKLWHGDAHDERG
jgi:hypothetical protein